MSNRILLIDFDARTLAKWHELLEEKGYDVVSGRNASDATKQLGEDPRPRLVILEPMMPGLDGFTLCRSLKSDKTLRPPAVVIASRIYRGQKYRGFARDAGADLFIEKPIGDADLLEIVARWVEPGEPPARPAPHAGLPVVTTPLEKPTTTGSANRTIPLDAIAAAPPAAAKTPPTPAAPPKPAAAAATPPVPAARSAAESVGIDAGADTGIDLGSVTDDDIDDALSRLALPGFDDPEPVETADPGDASPAAEEPVFSSDDLASALDRLELTSDDAPGGSAVGESSAKGDPDASGPDDEARAKVGAEAPENEEAAIASPPGTDAPPFFARSHDRPGEGDAPPPAPAVRSDELKSAATPAPGSRSVRATTAASFESRLDERLDDALAHLTTAPRTPREHAGPGVEAGGSPLPPPQEASQGLDALATPRVPVRPARDDSDDEQPGWGSGPLPPWREPQERSLTFTPSPGGIDPDGRVRVVTEGASGPIGIPVEREPRVASAPSGAVPGPSITANDVSTHSGVESGIEEALRFTPAAEDAALSVDPRDDAPVPEYAPTGPLRGMDAQTADLLSTLEELEDSLPEGILEGGRQQASLAGSPTREEEEQLDEVIGRISDLHPHEAVTDDVPTSIASEPIEQEDLPAGAAADGSAEEGREAIDAYYEALLTDTSQRRTGLWVGVLVAVIVFVGSLLGVTLFRGEEDASRAPGTQPASGEVAEPPAGSAEEPTPVRAVPEGASAAEPLSDPSEAKDPGEAIAARPAPRADSVGRETRPQVQRAPARPDPEPAGLRSRSETVRSELPPAPEPPPVRAPAGSSGGIPVVELSELDRPLRLKEYSRPEMPEAAMRAGARDRVFVQVLVGPEGEVLDAKTLMDPGHGLADVALATVREWRFTRPSRDLEPVRVWKTEVVAFDEGDG